MMIKRREIRIFPTSQLKKNMDNQKKFGTFSGVFTPSILTILGVMMYLRFGTVVGNAGLYGTIAIIFIAHIISVTTGLSVSSIATDKKVGAGGVYYVLSRSLGLPIGGSLGITLFVATAFSIALYMVGFAEVFDSVLGLNLRYEAVYQNVNVFSSDGIVFYKEIDASKILGIDLDNLIIRTIIDDDASFFHNWSKINAIRFIGSIGLLVLTIIALISTSIAIKTQFIILALIILSLIAIGIGDVNLVTNFTEVKPSSKLSYFEAFALFFPAVTGFTAGIAMSGDLKNPKKSIPVGTMLSILVGFLVYMGLALFIYYSFSKETLIENGNLFYEITIFGGIFVILGAAGATLSSALGGILGGPRILQAMSVDKITPSFFGKGVGKDNEPRNALILTVIIAEAGILIGDLNVIAEIVSMFYLAAYGFINLSFFLESWASADFNPSFKVKKWVGLIGFIATFTIMFQLNMMAMVAAFVIIGFIYFYLNKKQLSLGTGDIWQSVWATIVKKGLRKMEVSSDHKRNWKPNILLFSGGSADRGKYIEFSKSVSGQAGIITNFDLIENTAAKVLFPKHKQIVQDEELEKYGIFGRQIEVQNEFKGIESIASTFGFSGIEPNTTLIPWPGETKDPIWFTEMTSKLIDLDYNVLYLDYDKRWGFRKKEQIDLWWRSVSNNAELMLSLVKFISTSSEWVKANIRILLVNETNTENHIIEKRIQTVVDQFRIKCQIKIISNMVDKIPIYELMKMNSASADLVFVGIPDIEEPKNFIKNTNELVNTIGTTLLVKASSHFDETDLKVETIELKHDPVEIKETVLNELKTFEDPTLNKTIHDLDLEWSNKYHQFLSKSIQEVESYHHQQNAKIQKQLNTFFDQLESDEELNIWLNIENTLKSIKKIFEDDVAYQLPEVYGHLNSSLDEYLIGIEDLFNDLPFVISINKRYNSKNELIDKKKTLKFKKFFFRSWETKGKEEFKNNLLEFGYQNYILLHQSKKVLHDFVCEFIEEFHLSENPQELIKKFKDQLNLSFISLDKSCVSLNAEFYKNIRNSDRSILEKLGNILQRSSFRKEIQTQFVFPSKKEKKSINHILTNFSGYWQRNLILFTLHLEADLYLIQFTSKIESIIKDIVVNSEVNYIDLINENIAISKLNNQNINALIEDNNDEGIKQYGTQSLNEVYFNLESQIQYLIDNIQEELDTIPEEVELFNAKSVNNIRKSQATEIKTIKIQLDDIVDYLVKTNLFKPFQDHLTNYVIQLKKGLALLLNSTYKIQSELDFFAQSNDKKQLVDSVNESSKNIIECEALLKTVHKTFLSESKTIKNSLNESLDINKIIEQYEILHPQAKLDLKSNRFRNIFKKITGNSKQKIEQLLTKIIQRKSAAHSIDYIEKHKSNLSPISIYQNFTNKIRTSSEIENALPFYYHQLFTGKHFSDTTAIRNRESELIEATNAINSINNGISGAILVLGESLSGKSFFINQLINQKLKTNKVLRLKLQNNKKTSPNYLNKLLQNATGIKSSTNSIMNQLSKRVIIIEDIEKWWLNANKGSDLINDLSQFINKYGSEHYFIISTNIYAYKFLKANTQIDEQILSSIILKPLSNIEIKNIIESRHQLGGMSYVTKGHEEKYLSSSKQNKLLNRYYEAAEGNIGLALRLWIASIENVDENKLYLHPIQKITLPKVPSEIWQSLLYQFQIHKQLHRTELYRIYGNENKDWIDRNLSQLLKSKLLVNTERDFYELPSDIRYYIEKAIYE